MEEFYQVIIGFNYEGESTLAFYKTKEEAMTHANLLIAEDRVNADWMTVCLCKFGKIDGQKPQDAVFEWSKDPEDYYTGKHTGVSEDPPRTW